MNKNVVFPKDQIIFKPTSWRTKIDLIKRLIFKTPILLALMGGQSTGKTTFLRLLQSDFILEY